MDTSQFMCISLEIRARYIYIQALQESVLILIKSILVFYKNPFFLPSAVDFVHLNSTLLSCPAVSRLGKRPTALSIDSSTGVTLAS
jgi:hypothetical protein